MGYCGPPLRRDFYPTTRPDSVRGWGGPRPTPDLGMASDTKFAFVVLGFLYTAAVLVVGMVVL